MTSQDAQTFVLSQLLTRGSPTHGRAGKPYHTLYLIPSHSPISQITPLYAEIPSEALGTNLVTSN